MLATFDFDLDWILISQFRRPLGIDVTTSQGLAGPLTLTSIFIESLSQV
jgi:hypothetical protein